MHMIIDTHCHYNLEPLYQNVDQHLEQALAENIAAAVVVGTSIDTSITAVTLTHQHRSLFASVGIHPQEITESFSTQLYTEETIAEELQKLEELLLQESHKSPAKIVAIGEAGLDYYRLKSKGAKRETIVALQKKLYIGQLELAWKYSLPLIAHIRDQKDRTSNTAYDDNLEILRGRAAAQQLPTVILHCISGTAAYVAAAVALGAYIGVAGNSTYESAQDLRELIAAVPSDRVLLETDAPFLPPKSSQNAEFCEPRMIAQTGAFLAEYSTHTLATILENTYTVFPSIGQAKQL